MTFGEKLSKLRKDDHYTQEQLAALLDVSRQSISKWESNLAYPETDKLIKMGKLFECTMDYLLNEDITENQKKETVPPEPVWNKFKKQIRERKSEKMLCGMPLYHIGKNAHGCFAIGKTVAEGKIYSHIGTPSSADMPLIFEWFDINVPSWLHFAKEIFKILIP